MNVDNRKDIVLLLLYASGYSKGVNEPVEGVTRLQKLLFLLDKEYEISKLVPNYFNFVAFDYGPFDEVVFSDIEALVNYGLVERIKERKVTEEDLAEKRFLKDYFYEGEEEESDESQEQTGVDLFRLTSKGEEISKQLFESLKAETKEAFCKLKKRFNQRSLTSLIKYVYSHYPDYAKYSKLEY